MTEPPDFVMELWNELEQLPCETEGKASLIVNFAELKAACAAVIRKASARQCLEGLGDEELRLSMTYTPRSPEDVMDGEN